jgi:hypothetical protein
MLGFLIGTACLIGLVKTLRWGRHGGCGYGRRGWGRGGWDGPWGHGHHGGYGHGWGRTRDGGEGGFGGGPFDGGPFDGGPFDGGPFDGGWRGGFGGSRMFLRMLFRSLETTPGQEKVIVAAAEEMREATREARAEVRTTRGDLAKAMRGAVVDEVMFGEMFARHDAALEKIRKATVGAVAKVHDALDERQRSRFADLIESGPRGFRGGRWASDHHDA